MPLRISLHLTNPTLRDKGEIYSRVLFWIKKILYILSFLTFGIALLCLPWFSFWDNNRILYDFPQLRPMVSNFYFKVVVFGLGIADICIAICEIVRLFKSQK